MMKKTVKASIGKGDNKIEFEMPIETSRKVLWLQKIIKEKEILRKQKMITNKLQTISKQKRRQYNLVYRIRKKGYTVCTKGKTIYFNGSILPDKLKLVNKLRQEFNFNLQLELIF